MGDRPAYPAEHPFSRALHAIIDLKELAEKAIPAPRSGIVLCTRCGHSARSHVSTTDYCQVIVGDGVICSCTHYKGETPMSAPEPTPSQVAWNSVGYAEGTYTDKALVAEAAAETLAAAQSVARRAGPFDIEAWWAGRARYRAEHWPKKEARP